MEPGDAAPQSSQNTTPTPSFFHKWRVATRPFALPASTMSVFFGTVLAVTIGNADFNLLLFLSAFFGMAFLHTEVFTS